MNASSSPVKPVEDGMHTVTPHLVCAGAADAIAFYARACGWTLARAHARSGDPIAIAAYLGKRDRFERSSTDFAERYADQNERDHQAFVKAIRSGRLPALEGV